MLLDEDEEGLKIRISDFGIRISEFEKRNSKSGRVAENVKVNVKVNVGRLKVALLRPRLRRL